MRNKFLEFKEKKDCCGCNACAQICPKKCIKIFKDNEGFEYPSVNLDECIDCGLCKKVCPMEINDFHNDRKATYAAKNKDKDVLMKSSSGGVFAELAKLFIDNYDGIVFGVEMTKDNQLRYIGITKKVDLERILGSKYIQAKSQNVYEKIKKELNNKKMVLICSTPCFIAGLKKYLQKSYDNLLCIDFICHGVPSEKIFNKYISWLEKKENSNIENFQFRNKEKYGWGITATYKTNKTIKSELTVISPYIWAYLKNYLHRPSCYSCIYADENRSGDITIGDFWDMEKADCLLDCENGISLVKINNKKGNHYFNLIKNCFIIQQTDYEKTLLTNEALYKPSSCPKNRDLIYKNIDSMSFDNLIKYFNMPNKYVVHVKKMIPSSIKKRLKILKDIFR